MAGGLNQVARTDSLTRFGGGSPGAAPSYPLFVLLATADPGDSTAISNEATGTGYARPQINAIGGASPAWAAVTGTNPNILANANAVVFGPSGGAWSGGASQNFFGIATAVSAGSLLGRGSLTAPIAVAGSGVTITFATGQLQLTAAPT